VDRFAVDNLEAAIFKFNTYSVIAIHNTNAAIDWLVNLDVLPIKGAHGGYYKAVQRLSIIPQKIGGNPFYVTGHSMGGAISILYSMQHIYNPMWLGTYTFASPRVSCPSYVSLINNRMQGKLFNIQNKDDIVSKLPPFYEHLGEITYLEDKTKEWGLIERHMLHYFLACLHLRLSNNYR
jgi:hypothetical protein